MVNPFNALCRSVSICKITQEIETERLGAAYDQLHLQKLTVGNFQPMPSFNSYMARKNFQMYLYDYRINQKVIPIFNHKFQFSHNDITEQITHQSP